jgi:hypothetical protein
MLAAAKPKPGDWVAIKIRIREEDRRKLERIAILENKTINTVMSEILRAGVLAHQAGLGYGTEAAVSAIQRSSTALAVEETLRRLNIDPGKIELTHKSE